MPYGMKRIDLRALAQEKLEDAVLLFKHERYSNSYYLSGYAVEIGLKACIASQISAETIPDKAFLNKIFRHEFSVLIGLAGLGTILKEQQDKNPEFAANWALAGEWLPDVRYETKDARTAQLMLNAVGHDKSGVLQWIKMYW